MLWSAGRQNQEHCRKTPITCGLLASMPEITGGTVQGEVKFSLMQPGTIVRPHTGTSNKRVRVHLGLVVPAGCCEITVGNKPRAWEEGEVTHEHKRSSPKLVHFSGGGLSDRLACVDSCSFSMMDSSTPWHTLDWRGSGWC